MSETESENESDLDFSASEDEYIPTDDADSDEETNDSDDFEEVAVNPSSSKKKNSTQKKRNIEDDDDSDSSIENYLVNPNEIDLASDFFNPNKPIASNVPKFDCNVGLNLSDSDEEILESVPSTSSQKLLDFNAHENFHKRLDNAKEQLQNFKGTNFGEENSDIDVTKLLAIGEQQSSVVKKSLKSKRREVLNTSDESDFEEVEEDVKNETRNDVEVHIGPVVKQKINKHQAEIEASIKRKINRRMKENQLMMHQVHLLSWIGYGNFVNKVLNSTKLMEMVVKYIPSEKCYPKDQTDQKYFEQIIKWFKTTVGLKGKEQNCNLKCLPPITTSLALQIQSKMAICKKDFVFIFIILLRSMGIQCRLVINFATVPIRPPAKDLCVISTKTVDKAKSTDKAKSEKKTTKKGSSSVEPNDKGEKSSKSKSATSSIVGKKSEMVNSPEQSLKSGSSQSIDKSVKSVDDKKKNLKRSVSVQSNSAVNDNSKRSRIQPSNSSKPASSTQNEIISMISQVSKSISDNKKSTKTKAAKVETISSPISQRTRNRFSRAASTSSTTTASKKPQTIPQLDGGNDKKSKKPKTDVYRIKFPLRARSVSPTSSASLNQGKRRPTSVATVSVPRGRARSNASTSRSESKSPTSKIERTSRKSKFEESKSSTVKSTKRENSEAPKSSRGQSKSSNPMTSKSASSTSSSSKRTASSADKSPTKMKEVKVKAKSSSASTTDQKPSTEKNHASSKTEPKETQLAAKPSKPSTSKAADKKSSTVTDKTLANGTSSSTTKSSNRTATSSLNSLDKPKSTAKATSVEKSTKTASKRKATISVSSDSDFAPTPKKKSSPVIEKPLPRQVEKLKKRIDRRILSTDDESTVKKDDMNYWIEVYCEAESKWICIDLFKLKVDCVEEIKKKATKPIAYVFGWNNNNKIKDISPRYCSQWNTTTRKLRVESYWLEEAISRYKEPLSQRCVAEDRELEEIHSQTPIPTSISELKNHPLYIMPRHLLKFEGIYPPNPVPVGFIRDEPIYSRLCLHTLHSREIWVKQARVVKAGEIPYKIVKARPKWDRLTNKMLEPQPLEIFGRWQTEPYVPPTAENGVVPRNAYGNVELFKPEMLPKKTVHLRLAGLNRVCAKLKIDCAQAVVGFDFHGGSSHPTFDGFVVCEEFAELVTAKWCEEQEEAYLKSKEKQSKRIYDNWKKLIKGLLIRERLQRKYDFAGKNVSSSKQD